MNLATLNAIPTAPPDASPEAPVGTNNAQSKASGSHFAALLHPASRTATTLADDAAPVDDSRVVAMPLTPAHQAPETAADEDTPPDAPWPPDGLASLWLSAAPAASTPAAGLDVAAPFPPDAASELSAEGSPATSAAIEPAHSNTPAASTSAASILSLTDKDIATTVALAGEDQPLPRPGAAPASLPSKADTGFMSTAKTGLSPAVLPSPTQANPAVEAPFSTAESELSSTAAPAIELAGGELSAARGINPDSVSTPPAAPIALPPSPLSSAPVPPTPSAPNAPFPAPDLHADNFPDALGTHIQWLAEHKIGHAHLQLNPQDMGPVEVRLKLDGDQLRADFSSAQPEVRQALEHGLPRLRELLGEHGLNLTQADVSQRQNGQPQHAPTFAQADPGHDGDLDDLPPVPAPAPLVRALHVLDAYA